MADGYSKEDKKKKAKGDNADLLSTAKTRLESGWEADRDNRVAAIMDLSFLALDQWPESIRQLREAQGRPCLTLDHLNQHKNQVVNDIRQAKIALKAIGVDDKTDPNLAEIYTSLMRDIQYKSSAPHVYAAAADGTVSCGIGHFRFDTDYVDDAVFDQEIRIRHIPYPLAVVWDPASVLPDRSDAMWCFVLDFIPELTFKDRYLNAAPVSIDTPTDPDHGLYWATKEGVLVAEYWCKKPSKRKIAAFEDGTTLDVTDISDVSMLPPIVAEREVDSYEVEQCLITGQEVLEGPRKWAGKHIPIVPIIGTEVHLEKRTVRFGLIRAARDSQQLYNYWRSAAAELIALAPKAKWLATAKQIASRKTDWDQAHTSPSPYLLFDPDQTMPGAKPELVPPPAPPAAIWQEAALVVDDMKAATGIYDAALGAKSNETSGVAIARRQQEGDVSNYHFADNLSRSLEHAGRIMIDLIPKIYDTQRVVRLIGEDDAESFQPINTVVMGVDGEPVILNDLSQGRFDIRVDIGPSYTTQRIEAAQSMIEYIKADPEALPLIRDKVVGNMDWPGAEEIAERLKKTIPVDVLPDDEKPPQQPDPMAEQVNQLALKKEGAEVAKTEGEARKAHAQADEIEMRTNQQVTQDQLYGVPPPQHALPPPENGGVPGGQ